MKTATFLPLSALLFVTAICMPARAFAWPPTYGAEFELTNDALIKDGVPRVTQLERDELQKFVDKIRNKCLQRKCKVTDAVGKWAGKYSVTVTLESGWAFHVDIDPECIEIQTKPATLAELKQLTPKINDLIFKTAKSVGLRADFATGSGHFNMGVRSAFDDDPQAFLDYFVDYANHPELAAGAMSYDMFNAPPVSALAGDQREALADIVRKADARRIRENTKPSRKSGLRSPVASTAKACTPPLRVTIIRRCRSKSCANLAPVTSRSRSAPCGRRRGSKTSP